MAGRAVGEGRGPGGALGEGGGRLADLDRRGWTFARDRALVHRAEPYGRGRDARTPDDKRVMRLSFAGHPR